MPDDIAARRRRLEEAQTHAARQVRNLKNDLARARAKGQGRAIERIKASIEEYEAEIKDRKRRIRNLDA